MKTRVIFRMFEGQPIALFPELPGDCNPRVTCLSYQHIGQHGAACVNLTGHYTKPASPAQYADLLQEVESLGYDVVIAHRATRKDYLKRNAAVDSAVFTD